jgi:hypothetical protein
VNGDLELASRSPLATANVLVSNLVRATSDGDKREEDVKEGLAPLSLLATTNGPDSSPV